MEEKKELISEVEEMLTQMQEDAVTVLHDPKYHEVLKKSGWELVSRLSLYLTDKNRSENPQLYDSSVNLLLKTAETADPEDILFEFLEQAEKPGCIDGFIVFMKAAKIILLRLPHRRGMAIGWFCNAIIRYLSEVSTPQTNKLEGEEQLLLENNIQFQSVKNLYEEILEFLKPFLKEVESGKYYALEKHSEIYKDSIVKTLLKLFGHPLMNIHLEKDKAESSFRSIAENIVHCVFSVSEDVFSFLEFVHTSHIEKSVVDCEFNVSSLGVFYYLILVEEINIETVPCVYSNIYLLKQLLLLSINLMKMKDINAEWKGLMLAENALSRIGDKELLFEETGGIQCQDFAEYCTKIMIYSESKKNREKAVNVFRKFLRMFDPRGRFYMILAMQGSVKEPGFIGYLAVTTKDFVAEALNSKNNEEVKYFSGKCLRDLLKRFCRLEDGCETDLMRNCDQIISCLNLLRYLIIRDTYSSTGVLELLPEIENTYLTPLKKGIQMSRAHYELQRNEINQPSKQNDIQVNSTLSVGGTKLPNLSSEEKFQIINGALNTFDLMDSLLHRLIECVQEYKI